jgi:hypothetical protein
MSAVYQLMPRPDWAATTTVSVPEGAGRDPAAQDGAPRDGAGWARAIFAVGSTPPWIRALFGAREVAARLLRIPPGQPAMLAVREVRDGEALIDTDDRHLRFVAGVRVDGGLLHVTTAVQLKGWRGQVYFLPVRFLHDQVTRSMMTAAARAYCGE